ncbi:MAG TPA: BCCT family transporter [Paenalcaligenes hominis]|uniref:BCCT family transporter n=1 Tax=Paenalcaligenes hominis TaxID=643674 RepID=A0A9D2VGH3_9BURK|nr:BCCT family transporter [Paenalcaligenes hominis]NJB65065.1 choline/glycine/proline betaine transport protein [Paenalcaligenes hominis]GGE56924.1 choline transporter [Paenalcaligenes hominis]HJH24272.1 BCCT family transporter [Paenalcaligenes hominis]
MTSKKSLSPTILMPVFAPAVIIIVLMVIGTMSNPDLAGELFSSALAYLTTNFGWFYMLSVAFFLIFLVSITFTKWGSIKLGPDHADPEYSFTSWFAMLFSAGYGIALLFFGVAEPVLHYASPPAGPALTVDAAKQAMQIAFFHWGFHIWAIYGLVGLTLAYFTFRHGLPLSMRSALYPIIGDRIYGPIGHVVDIFAILGTLFGIATTLGLSVTQINVGLNYLWPSIPVTHTVQIFTIILVTALTSLSVGAGLDKGVKRLSLLNIFLAVALMVFVFVTGPTIFILNTFMQNTGSYLSNIVERTFNLQAYTTSDWIGNWTLFIFGWTIAWAPFVGLFIAKISRGRTIRQFIVGVMVVPTVFTFLWFSVFGDTALHMIMVEGYTALIEEVQADHAIALFKLFERLPLASIVSFVTVMLIGLFFVTSSDSGSLVIDSLASGGAAYTPVWQRVFWASMSGVVAIALLLAGGLSALQAASVISALPFAIIMIIAAIGMWRALVIEEHHEASLQGSLQNRPVGARNNRNYWKKRLANLVDFPSRTDVENFIRHTVMSSMQRVEQELEEQGWNAEVIFDEQNHRAHFEVIQEGKLEFIYEVRLRGYEMPDFDLPEDSKNGDSAEEKYYRAEVFLRRGGQAYDVYGYEQSDIISDILDQFEKYMHFLHVSPGILPWNMEDHDEDLIHDEHTPTTEPSPRPQS